MICHAGKYFVLSLTEQGKHLRQLESALFGEFRNKEINKRRINFQVKINFGIKFSNDKMTRSSGDKRRTHDYMV